MEAKRAEKESAELETGTRMRREPLAMMGQRVPPAATMVRLLSKGWEAGARRGRSEGPTQETWAPESTMTSHWGR